MLTVNKKRTMQGGESGEIRCSKNLGREKEDMTEKYRRMNEELTLEASALIINLPHTLTNSCCQLCL